MIQEVEDIIGIEATDAVRLSQNGIGIEDILEAVIARFPPRKRVIDGPLKA